MLFHVSEEPGIGRFEPRPSPYTDEPVVWAIDAARLRNYLLPRDCPRVTYYAGPETTAADVERFLGSSPAVIAIESAWLERLRSGRLYCYHLPPETFACIDECAGYFVSREPVVPAGGPGHVCRQAQGRYGDNHAADGDDSVRVHPNLQTRHAVRTTILLRATSARLACWVSVSAGAGTHGHRPTAEVRQPVTALRLLATLIGLVPAQPAGDLAASR